MKSGIKKSMLRAVAIPVAAILGLGFNAQFVGAVGSGIANAATGEEYYYYDTQYESAEQVREAATQLN